MFFTTRRDVLRHEVGGEVKLDRVQNHRELECWIEPSGVVAPESVGRSSGSGQFVSKRTNAKILREVWSEGAPAPRVGEDLVEHEVLLVATLPGPREPSKDEIEKHNLRHGATSVSKRKAGTLPTHRRGRSFFLQLSSMTLLLETIRDNHMLTSWLVMT